MKLFRASQTTFIFQVNAEERRMFTDVLRQYPVVPESYQRLRRGPVASGADEHQQLLDEALAEQRAALQGRVQQWLATKGRFRRVDRGFNFTVHRTDVNWLLQVLNDIRVGSWLRLGSPEHMPELEELFGQPPERAQAWVLMEVSGFFQMQLLQAIESSPPA